MLLMKKLQADAIASLEWAMTLSKLNVSSLV